MHLNIVIFNHKVYKCIPDPILYCVSLKPPAKLFLYKYYHKFPRLPLVFLLHCHQHRVIKINEGLSFETSFYWVTENFAYLRHNMP